MSAPSRSWMPMTARRREHVPAAVVDARELDAVVGEHARVGEAEDLEAARVGQDRPLPAHEAVQPAVRRHDVGTGAKREVIRVGEHELGTQSLERRRRDSLDRALGAHGHEAGREHLAVRRAQSAGAGAAAGRLDGEGEASARAPLTAPASRRRSCRSGSAARWRAGRAGAVSATPQNAITRASRLVRGRWKLVSRPSTSSKRKPGVMKRSVRPSRCGPRAAASRTGGRGPASRGGGSSSSRRR